MDHLDHLALVRKGIPKSGGVWADFGSGSGAFTFALAELIGTHGKIYSVDISVSALSIQKNTMRLRYPSIKVVYLQKDFTQRLDLPTLDGIIMANALHFQPEKDCVLQRIQGYLKPSGSLIIVEYNTDSGNHWVPYPLSFKTWQNLAHRNGYSETRLLARRPSSFLGEIYSALSFSKPTAFNTNDIGVEYIAK